MKRWGKRMCIVPKYVNKYGIRELVSPSRYHYNKSTYKINGDLFHLRFCISSCFRVHGCLMPLLLFATKILQPHPV